MNFVCLLMSDSELLRIKNKQKASYKSRKAARSNLKKSFHGLMTDLGLIMIIVVPVNLYSVWWFGRNGVILWAENLK